MTSHRLWIAAVVGLLCSCAQTGSEITEEIGAVTLALGGEFELSERTEVRFAGSLEASEGTITFASERVSPDRIEAEILSRDRQIIIVADRTAGRDGLGQLWFQVPSCELDANDLALLARLTEHLAAAVPFPEIGQLDEHPDHETIVRNYASFLAVAPGDIGGDPIVVDVADMKVGLSDGEDEDEHNEEGGSDSFCPSALQGTSVRLSTAAGSQTNSGATVGQPQTNLSSLGSSSWMSGANKAVIAHATTTGS